MTEISMRQATGEDAPALTAAINRAFRKVEEFFLEHDRITLAQCHEHLTRGVFLIAEEDGAMAGCVYAELRGGGRGYFGLLSVDLERQGSGVGKRLIGAAEDYCRRAGCTQMDMTIVNLRVDLPPYYAKLGYSEDGGVIPFPADVPTKLPVHLVKMTKKL
jgi:predicted N-acetyltransferase YhbS